MTVLSLAARLAGYGSALGGLVGIFIIVMLPIGILTSYVLWKKGKILSLIHISLRAAAPQTIPVLAGYFVLGMGYGIYVQSLGLPVWMPMLMGTVVYGGSLEFVLASLLLSAFSPLSAFLMALMIQARHLFYGLAMLERYKGYGLRSFYMIFAMSDETFSITCSAKPPEGVDRGWFMFFITLLDQCYWVFSAGLGAVVGSVLPFSTEGVDFVMRCV